MNDIAWNFVRNKNRENAVKKILKKYYLFFTKVLRSRNNEISNPVDYFNVEKAVAFDYPNGIFIGRHFIVMFNYLFSRTLEEIPLTLDRSQKSIFALTALRSLNGHDKNFSLKNFFTERELELLFFREEDIENIHNNKKHVIKNKVFFSNIEGKKILYIKDLIIEYKYENIVYNMTGHPLDEERVGLIIYDFKSKDNFVINQETVKDDLNSLDTNTYFLVRTFPNISSSKYYAAEMVKIENNGRVYYALKNHPEKGSYFNYSSSEILLNQNAIYFENNQMKFFSENEEKVFNFYGALASDSGRAGSFNSLEEFYSKYLSLYTDYNCVYSLTNEELYEKEALTPEDLVSNGNFETAEFNYELIVNKALEKARENISETGLGLTQNLNLSQEEANENFAKIKEMAEDSGYKVKENVSVVEVNLNETEYYKNNLNELNILFPETLPEKVFKFNLNFNWSGYYIGYIFSGNLKKEIRKKYLISTKSMHEYYVLYKDKKELEAKQYFKSFDERELNSKFFDFSYVFPAILRKEKVATNKILKNESLSEEQKNEKIEANLNKILNSLVTFKYLLKGDVITCIPNSNTKTEYGKYFAIVTGEPYYDYIDGTYTFYVPVIEANFLGSVIERVKPLTEVIMRYRFGKEDFANFDNVQQPVEKNSNDEIYFRRK